MCSNNDYRNYLSHHGIIGMHWGIRRYQPYGEGYNPKRKGKEVGAAKKAQLSAKTAVYAHEQAVRNTNTAIDILNDTSAYKKKYVDSGIKGQENWLDDMYGTDWHDKEYMKEVFLISDPYKHAKEEIRKQYEEVKSDNEHFSQYYAKEAAMWLEVNKKYMNTPISELSKNEIKAAKKILKARSAKSFYKEERNREKANAVQTKIPLR